MFAGPNGSGKSTLKSYLLPEVLGIYVMAYEMDEEIRREEFLNLELYGVWTTALGVLLFSALSVPSVVKSLQ